MQSEKRAVPFNSWIAIWKMCNQTFSFFGYTSLKTETNLKSTVFPALISKRLFAEAQLLKFGYFQMFPKITE